MFYLAFASLSSHSDFFPLFFFQLDLATRHSLFVHMEKGIIDSITVSFTTAGKMYLLSSYSYGIYLCDLHIAT